MPRPRVNTRVKDLPDLALLASAEAISGKTLWRALEQTFMFRRTHDLPQFVPTPPPSWQSPYTAMAREDELPWQNLEDITEAVKTFLDPILGARIDAQWDPKAWMWRIE